MARTLITTNSDLWVNKLLSSHEVSRMGLTSGNFYGWNIAGTSSFDGTEWNNGQNLSIPGTQPITGLNHLGDTYYLHFNGGVRAQTSSTAFDTSNESFTVGAWVKADDTPSGNETIACKWTETGNKRSWRLNFTSSGVQLWVSTNGSFAGSYDCTASTSAIFDVQFHHIVATYNAAAGTMTLFIDGKIVAHRYDAAIVNTRFNDTGSEFMVGAISDGASEYLDGKISDVFYYKGAMTFDQVRQLYVAGTLKRAYLAGNKLRIHGEIGPYGVVETTSWSSDFGYTSTVFGAFTGSSVYTPVTGLYTCEAKIPIGIGSGSRTATQLYNETAAKVIGSAGNNNTSLYASSADAEISVYHKEHNVSLSQNDRIYFQIARASGSNTAGVYAAPDHGGFNRLVLMDY